MPIVAIALALLAAWVLAVTLFGGNDEASTTNTSRNDSPTRAATTPAAGSTREALTTGTSKTETDPRQVDVKRDPNKDLNKGPGSSSAGNQGPKTTPEPPEGQVIPESGPTYNPLGKDIRPNTLTETQSGRIELAATQFAVHAYGFTGKGKKARYDYEAGVSRSVVAPDFYESPGARALADLAKRIESQGISSTAHMDSFEVTTAQPESVKGTMAFTVESAAGKKQYTQELLFKASGALWRVESAGDIKGGGE